MDFMLTSDGFTGSSALTLAALHSQETSQNSPRKITLARNLWDVTVIIVVRIATCR